MENDCPEWKLMAVNIGERNNWRSYVRSVMRAGSQLFGGEGGTDVDVPASAS